MFVPPRRMSHKEYCEICNEHTLVSESLSICYNCIIDSSKDSENFIKQAHKRARDRFNLVYTAPKGGMFNCNLCMHKCSFGADDTSFCGLRLTKNGKYSSKSNKQQAALDYYFDPLPCNCCAAWFCPAGTGKGYPEYAYREGKELEYYNLSIFFYGCSFNCLYCQNVNHKSVNQTPFVTIDKLTSVFSNNKKLSCVCFFGGSPEPQFDFALNLSEKIRAIAQRDKRIARICWEWNGFGNKKKIEHAANLSLESGGNIKFDLKAWTPSIHKALTGIENKHVLENFEFVGQTFFKKRPNLPVLNATTLLVPGYINEKEVEKIASFIASIDDNIPYSLLGFYPHFEMADLPLTSLELAKNCYEVARDYLKNVNLGNKHLLMS